MIKKLLEYSIQNNLRHIPSALSQYSYLKNILPELDYKNTNISIGKPFGSQAYYVIWEEMGLVQQPLSYGVKHEEIDFVNFSEETLGNALGVAGGLMFNDKKTFVNLSDGAFQMGPTLEAVQFIGHHQKDVLLCVDCNDMQLTGNTNSILSQNINTIADILSSNGWDVLIIDDEMSEYLIQEILERYTPTALLFKTTKGQGVKEMEEDSVKWHYKELKDINEITIK